MRRSTRLPALVSMVACVLAAVPAAADDGALQDLLIDKGIITEAELAEARQADEATKTEEAKDASEVDSTAADPVEVSVGPKGLVVESADGRFTAAFGGRMQWDFGGFAGGTTPLGGGTELRRARIKSYGTVFSDWNYKLEVNFDTDGKVAVTDGWIQYAGFRPITITLGHQKVPFSQQSMTSSNWQVFQERALLDAFIDTSEEGRRRVGAVVGSHGKHWNVAAGAFGEGLSTTGNDSNEDWGIAGQLLIAPLVEERRLVTVSGSSYYRQFNEASTLAYKSRPESHIADASLVSTGTIVNAESTLMFNVGSSIVFGAAHAQGEFTSSRVEREMQSTLFFSGWYIQAGYFITGESRQFDIRSAKFKGIEPNHKYGAWEIAARYSKIDLQSQDVLGGRESNVTLGLNWWVNRNIMFRFNYVYASLDPNSAVVLGGFDESVNAIMGRAQIVF